MDFINELTSLLFFPESTNVKMSFMYCEVPNLRTTV